ncbi:hypothetical protein T4C_4232 [Trichinella pseudospiralis]|uniref:Uncharacterized protein n=1 Tax=Trichinella pseudospiralis TaxID=6337 RepID=A0A0V1GLZ6_TRIPS|nr:hypothetical protein T4C_4232 [Trichinella pseudospiralis]
MPNLVANYPTTTGQVSNPMRVFRLSEVEYISRNLEKTENLPVY